MTIEFDHFLVLTTQNAPELEQLIDIGLLEGSRNVHSGQGTACRRIFFHNAMLEFLWVQDEAEVRSQLIASTKLWERSRSQATGYSPFGLCFRAVEESGTTDEGQSPMLPFETWAYKPPYLPAHLQIDVAENSANHDEPMIFYIPFGGRPDHYPDSRKQPLAHPLGLREITQIRITLPQCEEGSSALHAIDGIDGLSFRTGDEHLAEVWFDGGAMRRQVDLRSGIPLILYW